jgi:histidine triad (HIT) family protein
MARAKSGAGANHARSACVFCAIAAGETEAAFVAEEERFIAFLDVRPVFIGHVLVMPRAHVDTLGDLAHEDIAPLFALAQRVMRAQEEALGADGTFVATNNKVSQSVPHLHVHVVPRKKGDGLRGFFWPRQKYADEGPATMAATAAALRAMIRS